jgi:hypothetical protein
MSFEGGRQMLLTMPVSPDDLLDGVHSALMQGKEGAG